MKRTTQEHEQEDRCLLTVHHLLVEDKEETAMPSFTALLTATTQQIQMQLKT